MLCPIIYFFAFNLYPPNLLVNDKNTLYMHGEEVDVLETNLGFLTTIRLTGFVSNLAK